MNEDCVFASAVKGKEGGQEGGKRGRVARGRDNDRKSMSIKENVGIRTPAGKKARLVEPRGREKVMGKDLDFFRHAHEEDAVRGGERGGGEVVPLMAGPGSQKGLRGGGVPRTSDLRVLLEFLD